MFDDAIVSSQRVLDRKTEGDTYTSYSVSQTPGAGYTYDGISTLIGRGLIIFDGSIIASGIAIASTAAIANVIERASIRSSKRLKIRDFF